MSKSVKTLVMVGALTLSSALAHASDESSVAEQYPDQYFQIQSMTVEEIPEAADNDSLQNVVPSNLIPSSQSSELPLLTPTKPIAGGTIGEASMSSADALGELGIIVNVGQLAWSIVEANKPASNVTSEAANAVPKNSSWENLVGWSAPQSHQFHVNYKNMLGLSVIDFTYRVIYFYGGNLAGKGHFLNGVSIVPSDLSVSWGYTVTAQAKVSSVTNAGTAKNPVAAMELQMQWTTSTLAKSTTQTQSYYIRGDGQFKELN